MTTMYSQYQSRIQQIVIITFIICFILISKIFFIQIINRDKYKALVNDNTIKQIVKKGDRGLILDKNNQILAETIKKYNFWVNTYLEFDESSIVSLLSNAFQQPAEYYKQKLEKKSSHVVVEKNIPEFVALPILNQIKKVKGLRADGIQVRYYPYKNLISQVVGYVDSDGIGKSGIEKQFNDLLSPDKKTIIYNRSSSGHLNQSLDASQPMIKNGKNVKLTIDVKMQKILHSELIKGVDKFSAKSANGIIMDPNNGEIIAMASIPDFNPNSYYDYNIATYGNQSISNAYEPGSTYKIVMTSLAIHNEMILLDQIFNCENGEFRYQSNNKPTLSKIIHDHEPHENLTVAQILIESSNIGIFKIADIVGDKNIYKFSRKYGFGSKSGIELPNESNGSLKKYKDWDWLSNNSIAIGQEMSATTLQTTLAYSVIANGGYLLKPTILKNIDGINKSSGASVIRQVIDKDTATKMVDVLISAVEDGTGTNVHINGYDIAGKTGTAEKFIDGSYSKNEFISSFASFFPAHKPQYVIVINVDSPAYGYHWGNESAGRITREILNRIIINDNDVYPEMHAGNYMAPNQNQTKNENVKMDISQELMPNFKGKTLKEVVKEANRIGVIVEPYGFSGKVVWQSTPVGSDILKNPICKVKLESS